MANCGDRKVLNQKDASELTRDCKVLVGNLDIISRNDTGSLNLDGLEEVKGSVWVQSICYADSEKDNKDCPSWEPTTIESSTLQRIGGHFVVRSFRPGKSGFRNITLPRLKSVGEQMLLNDEQLEYLDVTALQEIGNVDLTVPNLNTLRHEKLGSITGGKAPPSGPIAGNLIIRKIKVGNLDSFLKQSLSLPNVEVRIEPGMPRLTLGYKELGSLVLGASDTNSTFDDVVFGDGSTESLYIQNFTSYAEVKKFTRDPQLRDFSVGMFKMDRAALHEWELPFDTLSELRLLDIRCPETITLPPRAANWSNFTLQIKRGPMRLASEYANHDGNRTKTWYWPEQPIDTIDLQDVAIDNAFL
jgi:hypothetical protein